MPEDQNLVTGVDTAMNGAQQVRHGVFPPTPSNRMDSTSVSVASLPASRPASLPASPPTSSTNSVFHHRTGTGLGSELSAAARPERSRVQTLVEPELPLQAEWVTRLEATMAAAETRFDNNAAIYTAIMMWLALNVVFFVWGAFLYINKNITGPARITLPIAKGCGRAMSLNISLLLLTGSKSLLTKLRSTFLRYFFPFDHIMPYLHRIIGIAAFSLFAGHTLFHIVDYSVGIVSFSSGFWWTGGDSGLVSFITGAVMLAVAIAMAGFVSKKARSKPIGFRLFFTFHLFGIVTFLTLIPIHARNFTAISILAGPVSLYLLDSLNRRFIRKSFASSVVKVDIVSEGSEEVIVALSFEKATGLSYRAGQYMDICIPELHRTEFHPFSIASGPAEPAVQMFIKASGRWTRQLAEAVRNQSVAGGTKILVRGPFGAPSQAYDRYNQVLLVSSGIGVTPMRGIWRQLNLDNRAKDHTPHNIIQTIKAPASLQRFSRTSDHRQDNGRFSLQRLQEVYTVLLRHDQEELVHNLRREFVSPARVFAENVFSEPVHGSNFNAFSRAKPSKILRFTNSIVVNTLQLWSFTILYGVWVCTAIAGRSIEVQDGLVLLVIIPTSLQLTLSAVLSAKHFGVIYLTSLTGIVTFFALACYAAAFAATVFELSGVDGIHGYIIGLLTVCYIAMMIRLACVFWTFTTTVDLSDTSNEEAINNEKPIEADFVWVTRKLQGSQWLLTSLANDSTHWKPRVFFSQEQAEDLIEEDRSDVSLRAGRPNWDTIIADLLDYYHSAWDGRAVIGVLFCGAPIVAQCIKEAIGRAERVHFQRKIEEAVSEGRDPDALVCKCRAIFHMENF